MKKMPKAIKSWLVPRLRRISRYWPGVNIARDKAKVFIQIGVYANGNPHLKRYYVCQNPECGLLCAESYEGSIDHIKPVISTSDGFVDWNEYIERLFCDPSNLSFICKQCHDNKTSIENVERKKKYLTKE
jgi:5-methylcytosine-specific restriction endonuclease McrA